MKIISIANHKGGVCKTTTSFHLAAGLAHRGFKVLIIDGDSQGNLCQIINFKEEKPGHLLNVLSEEIEIQDAISKSDLFDVIKSDRSLISANNRIDQTGKEYRLKKALAKISKKQYDYVVIDTPPAPGIVTVNALTASNEVIIPVQLDLFNLRAITEIMESIQVIREYCNPKLKVVGFLLTLHDERPVFDKEIKSLILESANQYKVKIFSTPIRKNVAVKEAMANQMDIFSYDPKSNGALDYNNFIKEYLGE